MERRAGKGRGAIGRQGVRRAGWRRHALPLQRVRGPGRTANFAVLPLYAGSRPPTQIILRTGYRRGRGHIEDTPHHVRGDRTLRLGNREMTESHSGTPDHGTVGSWVPSGGCPRVSADRVVAL